METIITTLFPGSGSELITLGWTICGVIWIYCVLWTAKDISSRTDNSLLQLFCVGLVFMASPIVGLPLYYLIRPLSRKDDLLGWQMIADLESIPCSSCERSNLIGHDHCVFCGSALKIQCKNCKHMHPVGHQYCFKCGAPNINWKD